VESIFTAAYSLPFTVFEMRRSEHEQRLVICCLQRVLRKCKEMEACTQPECTQPPHCTRHLGNGYDDAFTLHRHCLFSPNPSGVAARALGARRFLLPRPPAPCSRFRPQPRTCYNSHALVCVCVCVYDWDGLHMQCSAIPVSLLLPFARG
jgi:hypothetical protein